MSGEQEDVSQSILLQIQRVHVEYQQLCSLVEDKRRELGQAMEQADSDKEQIASSKVLLLGLFGQRASAEVKLQDCRKRAVSRESLHTARQEAVEGIANAKKALGELQEESINECLRFNELVRERLHEVRSSRGQEMASCAEQLAAAERSYQASSQAVKRRSSDNAAKTAKIEQISEEINGLKCQSVVTAAENKELGEQLERLRARQSQMEQQSLRNTDTKLQALRAEVQQASAENAEIEEYCATLQAEIDRLQQQDTELNRSMTRLGITLTDRR